MKKETAETLSELYAIRAVMSVVSQNNDEVNSIITNEIGERNCKIKKIRQDNKRIEDEIDNGYRYDVSRQRCEMQIRDLEVETNNILSEISSLKNGIDNTGAMIAKLIGYFFLGILITMFPVGIALTIVFYFLYYIIPNLYELNIVQISVPVVWAIASIIYAIKKSEVFDKSNRQTKASISLLKKEVKDNEDNISSLKKLLNDLDHSINTYGIYKPGAEALKKEIEENNRVIEQLQGEINDCLDRVKQIKGRSAVLVSVARNVYQAVNTGTWAFIDLLIDGFESGRADSLKRALNIIEVERRSQSLEIAMANATERLTQTISSSLETLGSELERAFDRLTVVIDRYNRSGKIELEEVLLKSDDYSSGQNGETDRYNKCNYSAQDMIKALLDKINISSDRLIADIQSQLKGQKLIG